MRVKQFAASLDAVVVGMHFGSATHDNPISDVKEQQNKSLLTPDRAPFNLDYVALIQCFCEQEDE